MEQELIPDFKSSYFQKRLNDFGKKQKFNYHKLDIICDVKTNKILDFLFLFNAKTRFLCC